MVVILKRNESERLQDAVIQAAHRTEDFCHPVDRSSLRLKGDFDEVAFPQRLRQAEQSSGGGNGLEFRFRAAAIFEANRSQYRIS